ncbi:hypothetical protein BGX28_001464, partial [Mortierella sp. GBA30]
PPPALPEYEVAPFSGIRIIDNGHVTAAPVITGFMTEFAGDVLRISHPSMDDFDQTIWDVNLGKNATFCDLTDKAQVKKPQLL